MNHLILSEKQNKLHIEMFNFDASRVPHGKP